MAPKGAILLLWWCVQRLSAVPLLLGYGCAVTTCHTFRVCHAVPRSAAFGPFDDHPGASTFFDDDSPVTRAGTNPYVDVDLRHAYRVGINGCNRERQCSKHGS